MLCFGKLLTRCQPAHLLFIWFFCLVACVSYRFKGICVAFLILWRHLLSLKPAPAATRTPSPVLSVIASTSAMSNRPVSPSPSHSILNPHQHPLSFWQFFCLFLHVHSLIVLFVYIRLLPAMRPNRALLGLIPGTRWLCQIIQGNIWAHEVVLKFGPVRITRVTKRRLWVPPDALLNRDCCAWAASASCKDLHIYNTVFCSLCLMLLQYEGRI